MPNNHTDLLKLEDERIQLHQNSRHNLPSRLRLSSYKIFITKVIIISDNKIIESYLREILDDYIFCVKRLKFEGLSPEFINDLISQIQFLDNSGLFIELKIEFNNLLTHLAKEKTKSEHVLAGKESLDNLIIPTPYFPLINTDAHPDFYGVLESVSVRIARSSSADKFIIIPSEKEIEQKLSYQINSSWKVALNTLKNYVRKPFNYHEIIIEFENKEGFYSGDSLGIALSVAFIEALMKFYNPANVITIKPSIALTGSLTDDGKVGETSSSIIEQKVKTVFFSGINTFVVPRDDENQANKVVQKLRTIYPLRNLNILSISNFYDVINRRDILNINRVNPVKRAGKFIFKNYIYAILLTLILILFYFGNYWDLDDNPDHFEQVGKVLTVKNKNGKTLWTSKMNFDPMEGEFDRTRYSRKILDVDGDNINEVIIAEEELKAETYDLGRVVCFDKNKNIIWQYYFKDTVSTFRKWTSNYQISIIDTASIKDTLVLFLMARNIPNFANAIFKLDARTGKRVDSISTLWNAGGLTNAMIGDFNEDGQREMIVTGIHNGFERAIIFSVDLDQIKGQTPAPERYVFKDIPFAKLNSFVLLPHSDYGRRFDRYNRVPLNGLYFTPSNKEIVTSTLDGTYKPIIFYFGFDSQLNFLWVDCADNAQQLRDSLVVKGALKPPFTNTKEYFELLTKQMKYWDGKEFIDQVNHKN